MRWDLCQVNARSNRLSWLRSEPLLERRSRFVEQSNARDHRCSRPPGARYPGRFSVRYDRPCSRQGSSELETTNRPNAYATRNASGKLNGYRVGGGFEKRFGPLAIGALYLKTSVKDDGFRVDVTRATGPATNLFIRVNPAWTQFRRSDQRFDAHSVDMSLTGFSCQ